MYTLSHPSDIHIIPFSAFSNHLSHYPSFLFWLPGNKKATDFTKNPKTAKTLVAKADIIFCLDFNSLKRIDKLGDEVETLLKKKHKPTSQK